MSARFCLCGQIDRRFRDSFILIYIFSTQYPLKRIFLILNYLAEQWQS